MCVHLYPCACGHVRVKTENLDERRCYVRTYILTKTDRLPKISPSLYVLWACSKTHRHRRIFYELAAYVPHTRLKTRLFLGWLRFLETLLFVVLNKAGVSLEFFASKSLISKDGTPNKNVRKNGVTQRRLFLLLPPSRFILLY